MAERVRKVIYICNKTGKTLTKEGGDEGSFIEVEKFEDLHGKILMKILA